MTFDPNVASFKFVHACLLAIAILEQAAGGNWYSCGQVLLFGRSSSVTLKESLFAGFCILKLEMRLLVFVISISVANAQSCTSLISDATDCIDRLVSDPPLVKEVE